ncbi:hypothetical protein ACIBCM_13645 [Streptomyces sp. NPDC051018]|uniref:hypothetical protein n=1 Tax=Streptomyces sp. NPDC051018 TaxID=3365639 RepID=UPI0037BC112F
MHWPRAAGALAGCCLGAVYMITQGTGTGHLITAALLLVFGLVTSALTWTGRRKRHSRSPVGKALRTRSGSEVRIVEDTRGSRWLTCAGCGHDSYENASQAPSAAREHAGTCPL